MNDDSKESVETKDLTVEDLASLDSFVELGRQCASMLHSFGCAAFLVDEQGTVRLANPLMVFFDSQVAYAPPNTEPRYVRPILTKGRPTFVAKRPDGSLWEVEYPDPTLEEKE